MGIKKEELLTIEVDVLVPCARTWAINENNADNIKAKVIVPSANRPITDPAEEILWRKNILSVPDFVSNIGGGLMALYWSNPGSVKKTLEVSYSMDSAF